MIIINNGHFNAETLNIYTNHKEGILDKAVKVRLSPTFRFTLTFLVISPSVRSWLINPIDVGRLRPK